MLIEQYGLDEEVTAEQLALEEKMIHLPAMVNLIHHLIELEV